MENIEPKFIPLEFAEVERGEQFERGRVFYEMIARRRTVRDYSDREVPIGLIERAIATAATAPFRPRARTTCSTIDSVTITLTPGQSWPEGADGTSATSSRRRKGGRRARTRQAGIASPLKAA